jgi:hypothetical protein
VKDLELYICEDCQEVVDAAADDAARIAARVVARARRKILRRHAKGVFKRALDGFFERWLAFAHTASRGWHLAGDVRHRVYEALLKPPAEKEGAK